MQTTDVLHEAVIAPGPDKGGSIRNSEATIVELKGGRLLLAWSDWYGGPSDFDNCRLSTMTSDDGGRTWSVPSILQDHTEAISADSPSFVRLRSGAILLFYSWQVPSRAEPTRRSGDVFEHVRRSEDEGRTWGKPVRITPDPVRQFLINDHGIQTRAGRIVLPISWTDRHEDPDHTYRSLAWYSDDDGRSWRRGRGEVGLPRRGAMEPSIVERRDGSLLMVIRTQLGHIYRAESFDGGDTWTPARSTGIVGSESPVHLKRIPSTGDLLMIWNHCDDPALSHGGRNPLTAAISRDDGETWENVRDLEDDPSRTFSYPSITFRGDEVLVTYYQSLHGAESQLARDPAAEVGAALGIESGYELKLKILPVRWFYWSVKADSRSESQRDSSLRSE